MISQNVRLAMYGLAMAVLLTGLSASVFAQSVTLSGVVIDEKSEAPIAGAKVELTNANAGTGYFVTHTGDDGRFAFTQV
ncbi:MAG: carboxypeptidase-like regulatory domain-containing protein, partial [Candidatus Hinthialibacter sp.]